jgi:hypothetical protein
MKTFEEKIQETLLENSEWSGSSDALWSKISGQLQSEKIKVHKKQRNVWFGAAVAATVFLAFMLRTMFVSTPLPPPAPEAPDVLRMQTFSVAKLPEPEVFSPGQEVELAFDTYLPSEWSLEQSVYLAIWKNTGEEETLTEERLIQEGEILGTSSLPVQAPTEPGLYRLLLEGTFVYEGRPQAVFGEKIIRIEGETTHEPAEND